MRSITRRPLSQRWSADALEAVNVTKKDAHAGRGARAVPFARRQREAEPEAERPLGQRAARRLELRRNDFDPAAGGHGWTEHCPKCDRARPYGWRNSIQMQHSEACRARIELALGQTHRGRERLEHTKLRFDRRQRAPAGIQDDAQLEPVRVEGEISGTGAPPTNLDDNEMYEPDESEDDALRYSPASPGTPMSVEEELAALSRGRNVPCTPGPCGDAEAECDRQQHRSQSVLLHRTRESSKPPCEPARPGRPQCPPQEEQPPVVQLPCGPARPGIRNSTTAEPESVRQQSRSQQRQQSRSQPDSRAGVSQTAEPESDRQQSRSQLRQHSRS